MTVSTHHGRRIFNQASPIGYWYQYWHQCGTGNRAVLTSEYTMYGTPGSPDGTRVQKHYTVRYQGCR